MDSLIKENVKHKNFRHKIFRKFGHYKRPIQRMIDVWEG